MLQSAAMVPPPCYHRYMTHLPPLIEAMLKPSFYPHTVPGPIQLVQTHISYVVLTGGYAYKVKKAVDLGFLNFSTLERRRHYCHEELRLNKLFAPALYLEVVPIVGTDGGYRFALPGEEDNAVEYAVKMKQFEESQLLINVFERGELTEERILEIATKLAALHRASLTNESIAEYGRPESVAAMAEENYGHVRPFIGTTQDEEQFKETKAFTDAFIRENGAIFERRRAEGMIRECHGDLHLNNICIYNGRIEFFDRIEFTDLFKNIDVIYDLAFLMMDLQYRGRKDLANILVNTYLEQRGDYEGALLLPLYLSMRAYVRGKVNSILQAGEHLDAGERNAAIEEAKAYFKHAWEYTRPKQGAVLCISGLSGSGKSTIARRLAQPLDALYLRADAVRKHLAGIPLEETGESLYTEEMTRRTYSELTRLGMRLADRGFTVILDAKFDRVEERRETIESAGARGLPLKFLLCSTGLATMKQRLRNRRGDVSDATSDLLEQQAAEFEAFSEAERALTIEVDTTHPPNYERLVDEIHSFLMG
ncbi:MAG: AAA family ATPase [Candidatus Hydrogenedentes bacterium]|nr:AAA family ATPase [Candidatus Hydrogenedentota bacterium]